MATLFKNLFNPVPVHDTKDKWYCNRRQFHGVNRHIFVRENTTPAIQFCIRTDTIIHLTPHTIKIDGTNYGLSTQTPTQDTLTVSYQSGWNIVVTSADEFYIHNDTSNKDYFVDTSGKPALLNDMFSTTERTFYDNSGNTITYSGTAIDLTKHLVSVVLRKKKDDSLVVSLMNLLDIELYLYNYKNSEFSVLFTIPSITLTSSYPAEEYYIVYTPPSSGQGCLGTTTLYSEPFIWADATNASLIQVSASSVLPITAGESLLRFKQGEAPFFYSYFIQGDIMMPPFVFEAEVDDIDGYKYAKKLVSYKQGRTTFLATEYFAEAIRMLWHCDFQTFMQDGETYKIDYIEPPEISWDSDNFLCEVSLTFNTDTIMQSQGVAISETELPGAYRTASYQNSFDN